MFTSIQVISIVGSILGGFAWLITFLHKHLDNFQKRLISMDEKLADKVSDALCQERRSHFPCCNSDGTFKCPLPKEETTQQLASVLQRLEHCLKKEE